MKIIQHTTSKPTGILLFGFVYIMFCLRGGNAWYLAPDCNWVFFPGKAVHFRGVYLQIGKLGGDIMFRSNKCLEL